VQPVLTRDEMRAADAAALADVSHETLVRRAGTAVTQAALRLLGGGYGAHVVVIAGKGSNGADARVAAHGLSMRGAKVTVIGANDLPPFLPACDLVIDGAYGTGFHGTFDMPTLAPGTRVLAIDIPSGVDADTGAASGSAARADATVTFAALKPGLLQGDGPAHSGVVQVVDIGIAVGSPRAALLEDADISALLPGRARNGHKWKAAVGIAAGSVGMEGAAVLCSLGALKGGSGMVRLGSPGNPTSARPSEVVRMTLPEDDWSDAFLQGVSKCGAVVVGPGLGTSEAAAAAIRQVIRQVTVPLVIDADGLTALGEADAARALLAERSAPTVVTPHDGEYTRLAGRAPGEDRLAAARDLAARIGAIVLLKGPLTVVATDQQRTPDVLLSAAGVPALATAGTGDVLSGVIGAFLARSVPAHAAAALAAHVHGRAGALGPREGLVAGDLPALVSRVLSEARYG
jgi:ADP-dependent NAD(P)H-hydrate dehydratase / NAD(P)H-hydrate epimerase